jgi:calmodulin
MGRPTLSKTMRRPQHKGGDGGGGGGGSSNPPMLTREFTEVEMLEFRDAFAMFDLDGGGTIETHELRQVLTELGDSPTDDEIEEMILLVDENGDGVIDFDEFVTLMRLRMGESGDDNEQKLRDVFDVFDADGSGGIDRNEMRLLMKKLAQTLTEEEISAIMEEVDADGDGEISFEEFKALML